jgi:hypothetical protein
LSPLDLKIFHRACTQVNQQNEYHNGKHTYSNCFSWITLKSFEFCTQLHPFPSFWKYVICNKYASCMNMASFARKVFVVTPFLPMRHINIRCRAAGTRGPGGQSPFRFWLDKRQNLQFQERHWITNCPHPLFSDLPTSLRYILKWLHKDLVNSDSFKFSRRS